MKFLFSYTYLRQFFPSDNVFRCRGPIRLPDKLRTLTIVFQAVDINRESLIIWIWKQLCVPEDLRRTFSNENRIFFVVGFFCEFK